MRRPAYALVTSIVMAVSMWFYVQRVMIGHQLSQAALHQIPRGNLSDLYPRWLGARELLLRHRDPYSPAVTREIQIGYYGRPIDPSRSFDPTDLQGFAYPVYVVFLLAPTITLPFAVVQLAFRWLLVTLVAASVPLWLRVFRWRASPAVIAIAVILTLGSFQVIQGIKLQQLSLFVYGLVTASVVLLVEGHLFIAGALLALATIKPQLALLLCAWLLLWALSEWRTRKNFVWGFGGTLAGLILGGEIALPHWIGRFLQAVISYRGYNQGAQSALELMFTPAFGRALGVLLILMLAIVCWVFRRVSIREWVFNWILALVLAATVAVMPKAAPYNQVLLIPPILLLIRRIPLLWSKNSIGRFALLLAAGIVLWPWLAAIGITVGSLISSSTRMQNAWVLPLYTSIAIPLAVLVVAGFAFTEIFSSRMRTVSSSS